MYNRKDMGHNITVHFEYEKDAMNQKDVHFENFESIILG